MHEEVKRLFSYAKSLQMSRSTWLFENFVLEFVGPFIVKSHCTKDERGRLKLIVVSTTYLIEDRNNCDEILH